MNLRELNYILIPKRAGSWERFAASRTGRVLGPFLEVLGSATTEGQVLFVVMLIAGAAGIDVRYSHLYLVFSGLFGLLVTALLLRPLGLIRASELSVDLEHPASVVAGERILFTLVLRNTGRRPLYALRVSGPFLPWDGSFEGPRPGLAMLAPGEVARLSVGGRFLVRGPRALGTFSVGSIRPLGLARGNRRPSPVPRFAVLPRMVTVLDMPLPPWRFAELGAPQSAFGGESYELLGVRPYRTGDRLRDLHARATARHGEPIVREMRQESRRHAAVVVDLTATTERELVDVTLGVAMGAVAHLVRHNVAVELCVLGATPRRLAVGERAASVAAAWEMLAGVEAGRRSGAGQADPLAALGELGGAAWTAAYLLVAHGPDDAPYARAEALRRLPLVLRTVVVVGRTKAPPPAADRTFTLSELQAGVAVTL